MSFFNKVLASVGIGSTKVDTKLERDTFAPGDPVKGIVEVTGGSIAQSVDSIYLILNTAYLKESDDKKHYVNAAIDRFKISEPFHIGAGERKQISFSFRLPLDTPVSIGRTRIWVSTGLDIKNAMDPTDTDYIRVVPTSGMASILSAVEEMGFRLREADCEHAPYRMRRRLPFVQEFEYIPVSGSFKGRLDELEVVMFPVGNGEIEVLMQVDRRARGIGGLLSEALATDESNVRVVVTSTDAATVRQQLQTVIERYS
ncbi:sporulation protein SpoOM [Neobacillus notoginsengisoli]|uniref:Sporulation protein SpoOM n=1 Tax=Neobacillus notoginsengisoli TaxID=1578198 RepID=A0A417YXF5_9BACI|nr:sporulation protein [Neobacillus notoginsengisoli]RHW42254.1 sporulation protein SpoOM [Neobacillus notoginsengisoli]